MSADELMQLLESSRGYLALRGWTHEQDGSTVVFHLKARDGQLFRLRLGCSESPQLAPEVAFVNEAWSPSDPRAWPRAAGNFAEIVKIPPASFLCTSLTREGLTHHKEWLGTPAAWNPARSIFEIPSLFETLLQSAEYQGRAG